MILGESAFGQDEPSTFAEAVQHGKTSLNFRYRYEYVDQEGISANAGASTLKTRLGFKTGAWRNLTASIEVDNVSYLGNERFNNTRNGERAYPVVVDPDGTHINQMYIAYKNAKGFVRVGRQRINLGGQRFVGGVGWRQNEQTYDGLSIHRAWADRWILDYSYVRRVSRIFGPDNGTPDDALDANIHLLEVTRDFGVSGQITLFGHDMDFDDASGLSQRTLGIGYERTFKSAHLSFPLSASYAKQNETGDNPTNYSASRGLVELGIEKGRFGSRIGFEALEGSQTPGKAFRTPLATLHKYQGWADKFLTTPSQGVEDSYVALNYGTPNFGTFTLILHDFRSQSGSSKLGREIDASWRYKFNNHYSVLMKIATYEADDLASDTKKGWLMFTANF